MFFVVIVLGNIFHVLVVRIVYDFWLLEVLHFLIWYMWQLGSDDLVRLSWWCLLFEGRIAYPVDKSYPMDLKYLSKLEEWQFLSTRYGVIWASYMHAPEPQWIINLPLVTANSDPWIGACMIGLIHWISYPFFVQPAPDACDLVDLQEHWQVLGHQSGVPWSLSFATVVILYITFI